MGFFGDFFKEKPSNNYSSNDIEVITPIAQRLVEVINESLTIANDSTNPETKISRLNVAKDKLSEFKELSEQYSFITIASLNEVESCIAELGNEFIIAGYEEIANSNHSSDTTKKSLETLAKDNKDIVSGFKLSVSMLPSTPLKLLKRHGEIAELIPESDSNMSSSDAVWLQTLSEKYAILSEGRTTWSPAGHIPKDDTEVLEYLIAAREIIEAPLLKPLSIISEALSRLEVIKSLPSGPIYTNGDDYQIEKTKELVDYFPLFFENENKALSLVLMEFGEPSYDGLSYEHILELYSKGFNSITEILSAPDEILMSLNGVGKKKLEKIRANVIG